MKKLLYFFLLAGTAIAQCNYTATISVPSVSSPAFDNSTLKCNSWSFSYMATGFTSVIVQLESTTDIVRNPFTPILANGNPSSTLAGSFSFAANTPDALRVNLIYAKGNGSIFFTLTGTGSGGGGSNFADITAGTNVGQSLVVGAGSIISPIGNGAIYSTNLTRSDFSALPTPGSVVWQSILIKDHYLDTPCVITSLYCLSNGSNWYQLVGPPGNGVTGGTSGQFAIYTTTGTVVAGHTLVTADIPSGYSYSNLSNTASGVTAGTYGDSTHCANVTIGADGRITSATNSTSCPGTGGGGGAATSITGGLLSGLPNTCAVKDIYFATDQPVNQQIYTCSPINTWNQIGALGGSGALAYTGANLDVVTSIVPFKASANAFTGLNAFSVGQDMSTQASGSTPASGKLHIYANTDNTFHQVTSAGVDTALGGGGVTTHWVSATSSTTQVIPGTNTATPITFDTNNSSTTNSALHSTVSNTANFVADATGIWAGSCEVSTNSTSADNKVIIFVNTDAVVNGGSSEAITGGNFVNVPWSEPLTSGDVVTCQASSNNGFTTNSGASVKFFMYLIH